VQRRSRLSGRPLGIPDAHRNTAIHAFLLSLIRDPQFPTVVNDIVVECGNALHQDVADRFVRGEDVPYETLRKIWLDADLCNDPLGRRSDYWSAYRLAAARSVRNCSAVRRGPYPGVSR
jgi:hypothetical protein